MKALCLFIALLGATLCYAQDPAIRNPKYLAKPVFPGNINQYISTHCNYPESAKENGVEGTILVRVKIDKEGKVCLPTVVRGVNGVLDREALRVVNSFPRFSPATYKGKPIEYLYVVPIIFRLE